MEPAGTPRVYHALTLCGDISHLLCVRSHTQQNCLLRLVYETEQKCALETE